MGLMIKNHFHIVSTSLNRKLILITSVLTRLRNQIKNQIRNGTKTTIIIKINKIIIIR